MLRLICHLLTGHKRVIPELGAYRCRCGDFWTPRMVDLVGMMRSDNIEEEHGIQARQ